jgi:DNA ligase D-like protein (predicted ligase)
MPKSDKPGLIFTEPMECLLVSTLPAGPGWAYEIKLDGYRAQVLCDGKAIRLLSRNGKDIASRFPAITRELANALPADSAIDGELVALDPSGKPSFSLIQNSASSGAEIVFFAFDLLRHAGKDLTQTPLSERRKILRLALKQTAAVQFSDDFALPAEKMLEMVRAHGLEGVVAKRLSSTYEQGRRTGSWVKMRVELSQELVIGGYTPGTHGFDAVLVCFYRGRDLHFCASVRAGLVPASRRQVHAKLKPLETDICPFVNLPEASAGRWGQGLTTAKMKNCVWLRPDTVAQFRFLEWTPSDHLRHKSFVALREDKDPLSVVKESEEMEPKRKAPERQVQS